MNLNELIKRIKEAQKKLPTELIEKSEVVSLGHGQKFDSTKLISYHLIVLETPAGDEIHLEIPEE